MTTHRRALSSRSTHGTTAESGRQSSDLSGRYGSWGPGRSTHVTDPLRRAAHRSTATGLGRYCRLDGLLSTIGSQFQQTRWKLPGVCMKVRMMIVPLLAQSSQTAKTEVNRTPIRALRAQTLRNNAQTANGTQAPAGVVTFSYTAAPTRIWQLLFVRSGSQSYLGDPSSMASTYTSLPPVHADV